MALRINLGIRWRWVVSFALLPLYHRGKNPGTQWIGGWVGTTAGLDAVAKRSNTHVNQTPIVQPVA